MGSFARYHCLIELVVMVTVDHQEVMSSGLKCFDRA
jgi:hypothetical protein